MLLNLLKRDLRLHWDVLVLPYVILALAMGALGISSEAGAVAGVLLIGSLFVPFLPMAIHLRENSQGTLADLVALPASRDSLVTLRYLEVALFAGVMIALAHLGTWLTQSVSSHHLAHFEIMDQGGLLGTALLLLVCFAYPLPFTLRWNGKGLAAAFGIAWALLSGISGLALLLSPVQQEAWDRACYQSVMHLINHPGKLALGGLALFGLSYVLSLKAFSGRDF